MGVTRSRFWIFVLAALYGVLAGTGFAAAQAAVEGFNVSLRTSVLGAVLFGFVIGSLTGVGNRYSAARAAASPGTPWTAPPGNAAALPR
jgi:hypothetical protein